MELESDKNYAGQECVVYATDLPGSEIRLAIQGRSFNSMQGGGTGRTACKAMWIRKCAQRKQVPVIDWEFSYNSENTNREQVLLIPIRDGKTLSISKRQSESISM